ncbi:hypothetical protein FOA52_002997 [Chlamydomonas sp. UWO 241]|nr:hypothetical protein FOA52_002997 [Chlamydomonas sp. UWO 241]
MLRLLLPRGGGRLPGPRGLPCLGCLFELFGAQRHAHIARWAEKYGPVFEVMVLGRRHVIVTDSALVDEILGGSGALPKASGVANSLSEMLPGAGSSLLSSRHCDPQWRMARKALSPTFSGEQAEASFEVSKLAAVVLAEELAQVGRGTAIDAADWAHRYALDVFGHAILGYDFQALSGGKDHLVIKMLRDAASEWSARRVNPLRSRLFWAVDPWGAGRNSYYVLLGFVSTLVEQLRSQGACEPEDESAWAQLSRLRDAHTAASVEDRVLVGELGGLLVAGVLPMGCALTTILVLLAKAPAVQERLAAESSDPSLPADLTLLTREHMGQLSMARAVVNEALRLCPSGVAGGAIAREVPRSGSFTLQGVNFPPGTAVWAATHAMHTRHDVWERAGEFDPDRWLKADAAATTAAPSACPLRTFAPFGRGPRACPAQGTATDALVVAVHTLSRFFRFELAADEGARVYSTASGLCMGPAAPCVPLLVCPRG